MTNGRSSQIDFTTSAHKDVPEVSEAQKGRKNLAYLNDHNTKQVVFPSYEEIAKN